MQVQFSLSKKYVVVILIGLAAVAAGLIWYLSRPQPAPSSSEQSSAPNFAEQQAIAGSYEEIAKSQGVAAAYAKLKVDYATNQAAGHDYAHVIGKIAYQQMGDKGLSICDSDLGFGCYHGFFEALIHDKGTPGFVVATTACNKLGLSGQVASCLHGLGHGVMGLRGDIAKAIDDCKTFADNERIYCYDGAYMEYYTGIVQTDRTALKIDPKNPWRFCLAQYSEAQGQCVRNHTLSALSAGNQSQIAAWCAKLEGAMREQCTGTTGLRAVQTNPALESISAICGAFTEKSDRQTCLVFAGRELVFQHKAEDARKLCQSDPAILKSCTEAIDQMAREYGN